MFQKIMKSQNSTYLDAIKYILLSALFMVVLSGCASTQKLMNKDEGYGEEVDFLVLTTPFINPDSLNRPSPIRLDLFQLREKSEFAYTDYLDLIDEDNNLNGDLIDRTQYILHPDDIKSMTFKVNKDTKYLGVAAGYQDINQAKWKLILLKQPFYWSSSKNYLNLKMDQHELVQLSKQEMREELKQYAAQHPESEKVTKSGRFKEPKLDYTKGVFAAQ